MGKTGIEEIKTMVSNNASKHSIANTHSHMYRLSRLHIYCNRKQAAKSQELKICPKTTRLEFMVTRSVLSMLFLLLPVQVLLFFTLRIVYLNIVGCVVVVFVCRFRLMHQIITSEIFMLYSLWFPEMRTKDSTSHVLIVCSVIHCQNKICRCLFLAVRKRGDVLWCGIQISKSIEPNWNAMRMK